eukprot:TRINITY_DN2751_c0_g1_i1.p2 TRINITY_DN2751_c0_g1~~TRINITY_DN2751_c0_g1_i1.p2  ORF type:complete len:107 (+),score=33.49 TRINITY_DN2751_c0_g1_i1:183-503(+)
MFKEENENQARETKETVDGKIKTEPNQVKKEEVTADSISKKTEQLSNLSNKHVISSGQAQRHYFENRLTLKSLTNLIKIKRLILGCLLYTSPSPRDLSTSRMPSSA